MSCRTLMLVVVLFITPCLYAASAFEAGWRRPDRAPAPEWFEGGQIAPVSFDLGPADLPRNWIDGQTVMKKRETTVEQFGAGASLGINYAIPGLGLGFWFEFFPMPFISAGAHMTVGYGGLTDPYENGGTGLAFSLQFGARFVVDFDTIEITRWLRPFVAFYPVGFVYFSGTEDFDVPGTGNTDELTYSDVYFMMSGGFGCDFMITPQIGLGPGLYIYGTAGGSEHKKGNFKLRTEGAVGVYFEYIRLVLRF